jgi:outer membrane protein TolC
MSRRARAAFSLLASLVATTFARPCLAQVEDSFQPDSALARILTQIEGDPLRLEEALALGLDKATRLKEAEALERAAKGQLRRERGVFDPVLFADVERAEVEERAASPFEGTDVLDTESTSLTAGARMKLRFGTEIEASLDAQRLETNSTFSTVNPAYDADGNVRLRQPLLKGFGPGSRLELSSAERLSESAEAFRRDARLGVMADVESTYWDLYAAGRDHSVQLLLVDRARTLVEETQTRASAGLVGPGQVANAQVFLAQQELASIDSEERLDQISDRLASLMGERPRGGLRFRPIDAPPLTYTPGDEDEVVARALQSNHALRAIEKDVESLRATWKGERWNALPQLDVLGAIGGTGLAGTGRDVIFGDTVFPSDIRGDFNDSFEQVIHRDFPTWSVGLEMTFPIGMREGRGERDRVRGLMMQREQQFVAGQRVLEEDVRARHREVSNGARRLEIARAGVAAAAEQVRIGLIEYRSGRTTAFELVRLAADYATAEQQLSQALVRTAKSAAALRQLISEEGMIP